MVGYNLKDITDHLESKFQPGMTWENYGTLWEIDHNTPISWFKNNSENLIKVGYSLQNLQPMLKKENQHKNARSVGSVIQTLNLVGREI